MARTVKIWLPCWKSIEVPVKDYGGMEDFHELCKRHCPMKRDPQGCLYYLTKVF